MALYPPPSSPLIFLSTPLLSYRQKHVRMLYRCDLLTGKHFSRCAGNRLDRNAKRKSLAIEMNMNMPPDNEHSNTYYVGICMRHGIHRCQRAQNITIKCVFYMSFLIYGRVKSTCRMAANRVDILDNRCSTAHIPFSSLKRVCAARARVPFEITHSRDIRFAYEVWRMNRTKKKQRSNRLTIIYLMCERKRVWAQRKLGECV